MPRPEQTVRRTQLASREPERDYRDMTPGERLAMVDKLTRTAWAFHTGESSEPRIARDIGRVIRDRRLNNSLQESSAVFRVQSS